MGSSILPRNKVVKVRGKALAVLLAFLVLPLSSPATNKCGEVFESQVLADASLLQWQGQQDLRKYRDDLTTLDGLSYTYTTAQDAVSYKELNNQVSARLTSGETRVLEDYTHMSGSKYERLNLDISQRENLKGARAKQVDTFLSAFSKGVVLPEGLILFRGIGGNVVEVPAVGKKIRWDRITSTSMNPETARYFITHEGAEGGVLLVIEVGSTVKALTAKDPREMEFLLEPGTQFKVVSKKHIRAENITIVHLRTTSE